MLPLRSVGRSNFDKGLHNLTTLIQERHIINENCCIIYIYIYIHTYIWNAGCFYGADAVSVKDGWKHWFVIGYIGYSFLRVSLCPTMVCLMDGSGIIFWRLRVNFTEIIFGDDLFHRDDFI